MNNSKMSIFSGFFYRNVVDSCIAYITKRGFLVRW